MKSIKAHIEGPLVDDGMEVSRRKLGTMVRQTAINKCLASFVYLSLRYSRPTHSSELFV